MIKNPYLKPLEKLFKLNRNEENAAQMKAYMKGRAEFFGIKSPERREIMREFLKQQGMPDLSSLESVILELWEQPEREYQYVALDILQKRVKKLDKEWIEVFEKMIMEKPWWDTVDGIASWMVGTHFKRFPQLRDPTCKSWMNSGNMWLQRTVILFQLKYKDETDADFLATNIQKLLGSREFFINKAIGWALREYSKANPAWVSQFVDSNPLAPLSQREAMRIILKNKKN